MTAPSLVLRLSQRSAGRRNLCQKTYSSALLTERPRHLRANSASGWVAKSTEQCLRCVPSHTVESAEVVVVGDDARAVFDRQCGQVSVVDEVPAGADPGYETGEHVGLRGG